MDAVYVVDPDSDTFFEAWNALVKLLGFTASEQATTADSVRFSLSGTTGPRWLESDRNRLHQVGWHFVRAAEPPSFADVASQTALLQEENVRYRINAEPTGGPEKIELRFDPGLRPCVTIPFEDRAENAPRFFGKFRKALAAGCGISEPKAEAALGEFYRHCLAHLEQETPFAVSSAKFTWTPRRGKVGGHTLFSEMQIEHFDDNVSILSRLLAELNQIGRRQPVQLYLQFFSSPERPPKLTLSPDHLHEMTFQYENLSFPEIQHRIGRLDADANYRGAIADAFLLLEQRKAEIGTSCAATYILRKTRTGGFEVRVTASWGGENIEPDSAIMPLEQKSGFSLARIG